MDKKETDLVVSEEKIESFCPVYFGVSCAFFALNALSKSAQDVDTWSELCETMLKGSSQLLGLLVWRIQKSMAGSASGEQGDLLRKLEIAEQEIEELRRMRCEDAKANEKVVGIFASQEQNWFIERRKLRQHIGGLMNELRVLEKKDEETVSKWNEKLEDMENLVQAKDKLIEELENRKQELEEKLAKAETTVEEFRENAKLEAQEHSTDLWKHKTAFLELVSNQRQLEAEMGRVVGQLEDKRQELELVVEQKEEAVLLAQNLSVEVVKMRKDFEQKDKILSAMLRKSKLDTAEKQLLLKEVKLSKAKRKQAELETERFRAMSESRRDRHSLKSMFSHHENSRSDDSRLLRGGVSQIRKNRSQSVDYELEYDNPEFHQDELDLSPFSDGSLPGGSMEIANINQLEVWVRAEAEKFATAIEKRHIAEIEAFAEQMRLKDEKLEAFRWRLLSMEIESKQLQSHIDELNQDVSQLRHDNVKLEALLLGKQEELNAWKEQFAVQIKPQISQKSNINSSVQDPDVGHNSIWSKVKIVKSKSLESEPSFTSTSQAKHRDQEEEKEEEKEAGNNEPKDVGLVVVSTEKEIQEQKVDSSQEEENVRSVKVDTMEKLTSPSQQPTKPSKSHLKMDLHSLGISYKIKRIKQQLVMLEKLTGKQEIGEVENNETLQGSLKGFSSLIPLLNKLVTRYQTLQEKTDELCKRMQDNEVDMSHGDSSITTRTTKGRTKMLEHFLEETFQLQRYMVSTGQKLVEVQSKVGNAASAGSILLHPEEPDKSVSFDTKRFSDNMRTLLQDVQRGLEVRIARIIGDLEGTLACEGMTRMR